MKNATHFMDSVFNGLNELKHERSCLAQRLTEQQSHRQMLEQELEQEALAIAQKKMDQCIFTNSRLQNEIDKHKSMEQSLRMACESEKNSIWEYMDKMRSTCQEIAQDLLQARDSYKEKALLDQISETGEILQGKKLRIKQDDQDIQDLNHFIERLHIGESFDACDRDLEAKINGLIRAIEVDINESEAHLLQLQRELNGVHQALQNTEETSA